MRAQAVRRDGSLVDDFLFVAQGCDNRSGASGAVLHVLNAPSPAATAALPIGREILRDTHRREAGAPMTFPRSRRGSGQGFACFVGRPNAGKSTLTNALIGQKVAITSSRPQTTRHAIRGILHRPDAQLIVIDTPGLHKPRTLLGSRLNDVVRETWAEVT